MGFNECRNKSERKYIDANNKFKNVDIPITVTYTDANGVAGTGTGTIAVPVDVVLYVPQPSVVPYQVTAFANAICNGYNDFKEILIIGKNDG